MPTAELQVFQQHLERNEDFTLLPIFLRVAPDQINPPAHVEDLYGTEWKDLFQGPGPEPGWAALAASVSNFTGIRTE